MVKIIDKNGQPLPSTNRNGKVRRLLKEKKARVVNGDPFTIQLLYNIDLETEDIPMNIENNIDNNLDTNNLNDLLNDEEDTLNKIDASAKEPVIKLSNIFNTDEYIINGNLVIEGRTGSGKTTLCKNIINQLYNNYNNIEIDYVTNNISYNKNEKYGYKYSYINNIEQFYYILAEYRNEIINRLKVLESEHSTSIYHCNNNFNTKVLIIDGFTSYDLDRYTEVIKEDIDLEVWDTGEKQRLSHTDISKLLSFIIRFSKITGVIFIYAKSSSDQYEFNFVTEFINNFIYLDNVHELYISDKYYNDIDKKITPTISLPEFSGLYANRITQRTYLININNI